ncbi:MAG: hypothetical protein JRI36_11010 [Deltaproteobacteria bacterium]|nr:hypothetical protein [Deltaproteobacteria bacterium]
MVIKRYPMLFAFAILALSVCEGTWAMNSLVHSQDLENMTAAGIGKPVIQLLVSEQTCSIRAQDLITLKRHGADDEMLRAIILADRYKQPKKALLTVEQWTILKKAGYSDDTILRLFYVPSARIITDANGHQSIVYGTQITPPTQKPISNESDGTFHINIERVETR